MMPEKSFISAKQGRFFLFLLILAILGGTVYWKALRDVVTGVLQRQDSSHGIFVPLISGYFLWIRLREIRQIKPETALLPGLVMLGTALLLLGLSYLAGFQLAVLSFLFAAGALILSIFGKAMLAETAFPLFFLATMIPIPKEIYNEVAEWMRFINTWGSVAVTKAFGVPLYREGYDIFIPGVHLVVNTSCSGIRYLLSFFTFSIVYAALFKKGVLPRLAFILGSIPFSIVAGITRLSVVFLAAHYISPFWAQHKPHVFLSWVVFVVFMFGAIGIDQSLLDHKPQNVTNEA